MNGLKISRTEKFVSPVTSWLSGCREGENNRSRDYAPLSAKKLAPMDKGLNDNSDAFSCDLTRRPIFEYFRRKTQSRENVYHHLQTKIRRQDVRKSEAYHLSAPLMHNSDCW